MDIQIFELNSQHLCKTCGTEGPALKTVGFRFLEDLESSLDVAYIRARETDIQDIAAIEAAVERYLRESCGAANWIEIDIDQTGDLDFDVTARYPGETDVLERQFHVSSEIHFLE